MDIKEKIQLASYLQRAAPEFVYEWLRENHVANESKKPIHEIFFWSTTRIPEEIESKLVERKNEIIDLGLAAWATNTSTLEILYARYCARTSCGAAWPPPPGSFDHAVLAALFANHSARSIIFSIIFDHSKSGLRTEDFNWLAEHGDDDLLEVLLSNPSIAQELVEKFSESDGAYSLVSDVRRIWILSIFGYYNMGLAIRNWYTKSHAFLLKAFLNLPKTRIAAHGVVNFLGGINSSATENVYVDEHILNAAVEAWNVDLPHIDEIGISDEFKFDGLSLSERVQFGMRRHYYRSITGGPDPDSPSKMIRLAAYATAPLSGENCLDSANFDSYSQKDGAAFMYALSYNRHISDAMYWELADKLPTPEERDSIYLIRLDVTNALASKKPPTDIDKLRIQEAMHDEIEHVAEYINKSNNYVIQSIGRLKALMIWGAVAIVSLLLFWR